MATITRSRSGGAAADDNAIRAGRILADVQARRAGNRYGPARSTDEGETANAQRATRMLARAALIRSELQDWKRTHPWATTKDLCEHADFLQATTRLTPGSNEGEIMVSEIEFEVGVSLRACRYCGLVDQVHGCRHSHPAGWVAPPIALPARFFMGIRAAMGERREPASVTMRISSTTGLPLR